MEEDNPKKKMGFELQGKWTKTPKDLLPDEEWRLVLKKIEDPKNLLNVLYSDPFFRDLWLSKEGAWNKLVLSLALPQMYQYLSGSDLLNLRKVSRGWRNAVDDYLETGQPRYEDYEDHHTVKVQFSLKRLSVNASCVSKLIDEWRSFPKFRIVGGTLSVTDFPANYYNYIHFFLDHGIKVRHLRLDCGNWGQEWTPKEALIYFRFVLKHCPNLQTLAVHNLYCITEGTGIPHPTWKRQLEEYLKESPMPMLPDLKDLVLCAGHWLATPRMQRWPYFILQKFLEAYEPQLEYLSLFEADLQPSTNLKKISTVELTKGNLKHLQNFVNVTPPLPVKKLHMRLEPETRIRPPELIDDVFQLVGHFRNTLRELSLAVMNLDGFPVKPVDLPVLEKLKIRRVFIFKNDNLQFLVGFPNLKELDLLVHGVEDQEKRRRMARRRFGKFTLKLNEYLKEDGTLMTARFRRCPIWKALPKLKMENVKIKAIL